MSLFKTNVAPAEFLFGGKKKKTKIEKLKAEIQELKDDIAKKTVEFHANNKALGFEFDNRVEEIKKAKDTVIKEYTELIVQTKKECQEEIIRKTKQLTEENKSITTLGAKIHSLTRQRDKYKEKMELWEDNYHKEEDVNTQQALRHEKEREKDAVEIERQRVFITNLKRNFEAKMTTEQKDKALETAKKTTEKIMAEKKTEREKMKKAEKKKKDRHNPHRKVLYGPQAIYG